MTVTFGGITITNASKLNMQQNAYSMTCTYSGLTTNYGEIVALSVFSGPATATKLQSGHVRVTTLTSAQLQPLVIGTTTYANCVIMEPIAILESDNPYAWFYTVKFTQNTYSDS